jgi:cell division septation protein DedD
MSKLQKLELLKDAIQQAIDRGASSVEQIHQQIADLPFEFLERAGVLGSDKLALRERKRRTIGMVYDAIRGFNRQIGEMISDQFENFEDTREVSRVLDERRMEEKLAEMAARPKPAPRRSAAKKPVSKPAAKKTAAKKSVAKKPVTKTAAARKAKPTSSKR